MEQREFNFKKKKEQERKIWGKNFTVDKQRRWTSEQTLFHYPAVIRLFTVKEHGALEKATVSDSDVDFWDVGI